MRREQNKYTFCASFSVVCSSDISVLFKMSFIHVSPESHFPIQNLPYGVFSTPGDVSMVVNSKLIVYWQLNCAVYHVAKTHDMKVP